MAKELDLSGFDEEIENEELDLSGFDDEVEGPSMSEAAARGAAQGLTFDFADELQAGAESIYKDLVEGYREGEPKVTFGEDGRPIIPENTGAHYNERLKEIRDQYKASQEAHPGTTLASTVAGGIIPAIFTGGASAAAKTGQTLAKEGVKQAAKTAAKESAKIGAGYGGLASLGMSEESIVDSPVELAKDVALGTGAGAALGAVTPMAVKGSSNILKGTKKAIGKGVDKFLPSVKVGFDFGKKYGFGGDKKINKLFDESTRKLVKNIDDKFQELGLVKKEAEKRASELGNKYNLTDDIQLIADDFRAQARGLAPSDAKKAQAVADEIEESFLRVDKQRANLIQKVEKEIAKKVERSSNKAASARQKAEGKAVMDAEKSGESLEQLGNINKRYEDISDLPYDTKGGRIQGQDAKFKVEYPDLETGEMVPYTYNKKYLNDATPFQPSPIKVGQLDDKLYAQYSDEATGQVFTKDAPASKFIDTDFANMTVDEMIEILPTYQKRAFEQGGENNELYKELYKVIRNKLPEISSELPKNKRDMLELYETLRILGIDKKITSNPSDSEIAKLLNKLPRKMDVEKDLIERRLLPSGESPIGKSLDELEMLTDAKKYLGEGIKSKSGEFTKAGFWQSLASSTSDIAGTGYGVASRGASKVANKVSSMADDQLIKAQDRLLSSDKSGLQLMGRQLQEAMSHEGTKRSALLWSLSQNPAFRKALDSHVEESNTQLEKDLGISEEELDLSDFQTDSEGMIPYREGMDEQQELPVPQEPSREPASLEDIDQDFMHSVEGYKEKGYVPTRKNGTVMGKSGVTIANALDLGQRNNLDDINVDDRIKALMEPYLGLKKQDAVKKLKQLPLDLSGDVNENGIVDAKEVQAATQEEYYSKVEANFDRNNKYGKKFTDLPKAVQTALYSRQFQTGKLTMPVIEAASNDDNYEDVSEIFKNSSNKRRQKEGKYIDAELKKDVEDAIFREAKQLGSGGGMMGDQRTSLDDLMGKLEALNIADADKQEMQESAYSGDLDKLQEMLAMYRS